MLRSGRSQDDLDAIRKGTLSGTAASTKIQADQAAILTSMGLTQAQVTQIQSDQQALQTAITAASYQHKHDRQRLRRATTSTYDRCRKPDHARQSAVQSAIPDVADRPEKRYAEQRDAEPCRDRHGAG